MQTYSGFYTAFGLVLEVAFFDGQLTVAMAGVPVGYEILLHPTDQATAFLMSGGPLDGARATFQLDPISSAASIQIGEFELQRVEPARVAAMEVTERLLLPEVEWSAEKLAAFGTLLDAVIVRADGDWIDYDLPYPKHEFLQYASNRDLFVFHGSNKVDIERFQPIRRSFELRDTSGRGNLPAVYATHDGIWPMFFAIVHRERLRGTIRNGVMYFHSREGEQLAVYNFSINKEMLGERPYCEGALYILPRDTFRRLKLAEEAWSNEWASEEPVDPIARLLLKPEDFPFLEQIGGHDDSLMARHGELMKATLGAVQKAEPLPDGYTLTLRWNEGIGPEVQEFLQLQREIDPVGEYVLEVAQDTHSAQLSMKVPPALRQVLANALNKAQIDLAEE